MCLGQILDPNNYGLTLHAIKYSSALSLTCVVLLSAVVQLICFSPEEAVIRWLAESLPGVRE